MLWTPERSLPAMRNAALGDSLLHLLYQHGEK